MKILYFDCFSGISGDMCLGAFLGLGVPESHLKTELAKLNVQGFDIEVTQVSKNGIGALSVNVKTDEDKEHVHRTYADICLLIDGSVLPEAVKSLSKRIFARVAKAEGKVHNQPMEAVHFHEVGALDSIVDIVGVAICVHYLQPERIAASVVSDGHGFITCRHGKIPVPVPAVMEIFTDEKVRTRQINVPCELVTPTGAAIVAELAETFGAMPEMQVRKVGYGAGSRNLDIPNVLRLVLGEEATKQTHTVTVLETNMDDCTPEVLGYVMERLLQEGAKDVYFTPIQMKKNRPAVKLTALCRPEDVPQLKQIIFTETTTIGIRMRQEERFCLPREMQTVQTPYGEVQAKAAAFEGSRFVYPEYESAKGLAVAQGVPLKAIYDAVRKGSNA